MKILFICLSGLKFNVMTPLREPLGGTESAVAYLAYHLYLRGHDVTIMVKGAEDAVEVGVKHIEISEEGAKELNPDVVIVPSAPQAIPGIKKIIPNAAVILWNHMQPDQPSIQPIFNKEIQKDINNIVYVSESQKSVFGIDGRVINNAISPAFESMFTSASDVLKHKKCKGAYTSTPYRGLAILATMQEIEIEVFSSMAVYQGDETPYAAMYEKLKANDCLKLNGSVSQANLADRLRPISFLVYPSIFRECHSIAIIEAMAAGLKVITTDMASPQTEFIDSMPMESATVEEYAKLLRANINYFRSRPEEWAEKSWKQIQYINQEFTWKKKAEEWETYLKGLKV